MHRKKNISRFMLKQRHHRQEIHTRSWFTQCMFKLEWKVEAVLDPKNLFSCICWHVHALINVLGLEKQILYSGKFSYGADFSHISHVRFACENKTTKIWAIKIFAWTLTSLHMVKIEYGQLVFCQIFERPTQRLLISRTIKVEAKKGWS